VRVEHNNGRGYFVSDRFAPVRDERGEVREFDSELAALDYIAAATAPATEHHDGQGELFYGGHYDDCPNCPAGPNTVFSPVLIRDDDGNVVGCSDCYINDDCPALCMSPHPAPEYGDDFTCPATGVTFRWCYGCEEHRDPSDCDYSAEVHGRWYCDPDDHGYRRCNDCDVWLADDETWWCDNCEVESCRSCYSRHQGHDENTGYDETPTCDACHQMTTLTHIHVETEDALCAECAHDRTPHVIAVAA
jgi:hypothetical protein